MPRICFLNPFGTDQFDQLVRDTLLPSLRGETEVEIRHLQGCPRNIDYYVPKHLVEVEERVHVDAGAEPHRLGAERAILGAGARLGVDEALELDLRSAPGHADLVGEGDQ